jgi:N-acetylglucosamine kinase-like BadF-type ATPase
MDSPVCKIGVDGGGTKTEFILVDASGATLATHVGPGCNPSQVGADKARELLAAGLDALLAAAKIEKAKAKISATQLYMAGSPSFWQETAAALTGFGRVTTAADSIPVLELATGGAAGLVLHAGTGSFVAARANDGSVHYAGGLGWKLGDAGSGFDLGRRAIAGALIELQGWTPAGAKARSPIAEALCAHTGLADYAANSRFFYNDPRANSSISAFAPLVLELAEQDCGPAQQVVADSVTDLARLADQVIHKLFPAPASPVSCGVSGRILNSVPAAFALRSLATKLRWPVKLEFLTTAPIEGVRRLLLAQA